LLFDSKEPLPARKKRDVFSGRGGANTNRVQHAPQEIPRDSGGIDLSGTSEPRIDES
jgi:hypothetical protein